jgi:hypothetical protein
MIDLSQSIELRDLPVGARFVRFWFPKYGVYTLLAKPEGSIAVRVQTASGQVGELYNWDRAVKSSVSRPT